MLYAVIITGGKQHRVTEGETLKVEKLLLDVGATIEFNDVLMIGNGDDIKIGAPHVSGGKVSASVISQGRHKKIRIVKFKRRKHHQKETGHRQYFTEIKIESIVA